jgi:two-component system phosphate regulon sensor histidine kinase PhoR
MDGSNFEHTAASAPTERERDLQRWAEFQSVLLAMAGHDLRQPLQVILSGYAFLSRNPRDDRERLCIERGKLAIAQLTDQFNHLIDALHLHERADMSPAVMRLQPVLASLCNDHAEMAAQKGLELALSPTNASVVSDPVLLEGILRNLVRNALKYTPEGGRILIGCRRRGPLIRIEVHDTGVGISPDQLSRVFDAFHRADSTGAEGLGLGLFVVKRAAELLGHQMDVWSELGNGSCFSVLAPATTERRDSVPVRQNTMLPDLLALPSFGPGLCPMTAHCNLA